MKVFIVFFFMISSTFARELVIENAPRALRPFVNYILNTSYYSIELDTSFKELNSSLNLAYASSTANQTQLLNDMIRGETYKWLLVKGKEIDSSQGQRVLTLKKNPHTPDSLRFFLFEAIKSDTDQMRSDYPGKKYEWINLSKVDKKKIDLLLPWYDLVNDTKRFDSFIQENIHLLFMNLSIKLKTYALVTPNLKKVQQVNYISFSKKHKPKNGLVPAPVKEWQDLNIYKGELKDKLDSRGLPLPVDDWILEL